MKQAAIAIVGIIVGALALAGARFAFVPVDEPVHYHANFAIFIEGERLDLSGDEFMEEVAGCGEGAAVLPRQRVHLHDNVPDVAHVHHDGATWGHLMYNLGIVLGARHITTPDGRLHAAGDGRTLKFILNGRPEFSVHNLLIGSGDRLLVSFGGASETEVLETEYPAVPDDAEEYNLRPDPASCAGAHPHPLRDRVRHAIAG
jgi:hypothetical protein